MAIEGGTSSSVLTLQTGDVEVGAVELKDASADVRAKVAALNTLAVGDIGLPVTDPVNKVTLAAILAALGGTLAVDTELSAAGPLATQATLASILTAITGTLVVDTELTAAGALATEATLAAFAALLPNPTAGTNAGSSAYETSRVVKASAGRLWGLEGYNSKASQQFIQLHDAASLPADTAVPVYFFPVAAQSPFSLDYGIRGRSFATGIVVCNSSTGPTKTIGSADIFIDAQYT